jgi:hypothetical protein
MRVTLSVTTKALAGEARAKLITKVRPSDEACRRKLTLAGEAKAKLITKVRSSFLTKPYGGQKLSRSDLRSPPGFTLRAFVQSNGQGSKAILVFP